MARRRHTEPRGPIELGPDARRVWLQLRGLVTGTDPEPTGPEHDRLAAVADLARELDAQGLDLADRIERVLPALDQYELNHHADRLRSVLAAAHPTTEER